ncbi:MAG: hypothetical protein NTNFB02_10340 [Nitrospira sp.]
MEATLTEVNDEQLKEKEAADRQRVWRETALTKDLLFHGRDEAGRTGWFLRLAVSGLYPRRIGPFQTQRQALEVLEEFIADIQTRTLCDVENNLEEHQVYVAEGVPVLRGEHDCP